MATQRPISTISYNSEAFLKEKLQSWYDSHIIQAYQYICHKGEDGDKDHIHLRIEPNKRLDPMDLKDMLKEYVIGNDKPLGVLTFRPSSEEDWILYAVHDADYLRQKYGGGENGEKLPYEWTDIKSPDDYDVQTVYIRARATLSHTSANLISRIRKGSDARDLILEGENVYVVNQLLKAMTLTDYSNVCRQLDALQTKFNRLLDALDKHGITVITDEDGRVIIEDGRHPTSEATQPDLLSTDDLLSFVDEVL